MWLSQRWYWIEGVLPSLSVILWVQMLGGIPIMSVMVHPKSLICSFQTTSSAFTCSLFILIDTITGIVSFSLTKIYFKYVDNCFKSMFGGSIIDGLKGGVYRCLRSKSNFFGLYQYNPTPTNALHTSSKSLTYAPECFSNDACNGSFTRCSSRFHSSLSTKLYIWEINFKSMGWHGKKLYKYTRFSWVEHCLAWKKIHFCMEHEYSPSLTSTWTFDITCSFQPFSLIKRIDVIPCVWFHCQGTSSCSLHLAWNFPLKLFNARCELSLSIWGILLT